MLSEERKEMLTEKLLKECWHTVKRCTVPSVDMCSCKKTFQHRALLLEHIKENNRTFLTPDDQQACKDALVKEGLWHKFRVFVLDKWSDVAINLQDNYEEDATYDSDFEVWFFRPTDENGEAHFCLLVAEFMETRPLTSLRKEVTKMITCPFTIASGSFHPNCPLCGKRLCSDVRFWRI